VKNEYPGLEMVHYLTDSLTSQYRKKIIFILVCEHETIFGAKATWNYLEDGHGKGPCDGLGASVKRTADYASNKEKQAFNPPQTSTNGLHRRAQVVLSHTTISRRRNITSVKRF